MKVKFRIQYNTVWGQGLTLISRDAFLSNGASDMQKTAFKSLYFLC